MLTARRGFASLVAVLVAVLFVSWPSAVSAHTDFSGSTPAAGDVVDAPVSLVTFEFTSAASPAGEGFVALTPDGVLQEPSSVETVDDKVFSVRFDPPLAGGQVGIRWSVRAGDAHPIEGAFAFTVTAPAPVAETVPVTTATAPTTVAAASVDAAPTTTITTVATPDEQASDQPATTTAVAAADGAATEQDAITVGADVGTPGSTDGEATAVSLDDFLAVDNSVPGQSTATIGRVLTLLGVALGVGGLGFVAAALRGRRGEFDRALLIVRGLGAVIVVGAAVEYVGVARVAAEGLGASWSSSAGFATVLRLLGGVGLVIGTGGALVAAGGSSRLAGGRSLSAAVIDDPVDSASSRSASTSSSGGKLRWTPTVSSWPALAGVALIVMSFWFDGHTVTKGIRPLHALINSVHVIAGSVWAGGVVMLAVVAWSRHRAGRPTGGAEMVIRFSKIATLALAAVVVAGGLMAVAILDGFGELTGTPWGKILLLKSAAVGLAALGGAYNHFRLLPALEAAPDSPELLARLRSTLTAEGIMLVFVVVVTAWLVAAAS